MASFLRPGVSFSGPGVTPDAKALIEPIVWDVSVSRGGTTIFEGLRRPERHPRSARYDPEWVVELEMGPHPLWQLEDLLETIELAPGMRVLDLGSGRGATSVFLAREFGVEVVACDLWVPADEAAAVFAAAGLAGSVKAMNADVRRLPFAPEEFDAIVSVDAFEYFGTDIHILPLLLRVLRTEGQIGFSTPALRADPYDAGIPPDVFEIFGYEAAAWHSPEWWRRHWELSGLVDDVQARWQPGGRDDWLVWTRAVGDAKGDRSAAMLELLEHDEDERLGFALISACKNRG
jgi:SAM-dependent methyltransferase